MAFLHGEEGLASPVVHLGPTGCVEHQKEKFHFIDPLLNAVTRACPAAKCYTRLYEDEQRMEEQGKGWFATIRSAFGTAPSDETQRRSNELLEDPATHPLPTEILQGWWPNSEDPVNPEPLMRWLYVKDFLDQSVYEDMRHEIVQRKLPLAQILRDDLLAAKTCMQAAYNLPHNGVGPGRPASISEEQMTKFKRLAKLVEHLLVRVCGGDVEKMTIGTTAVGNFENMYVPGYFECHKMGPHNHIKVSLVHQLLIGHK